MKIFSIKILYLLFALHSTREIHNQKERSLKLTLKNNEKDLKARPERKTYFSPYLNSFEDYSAKKVGA